MRETSLGLRVFGTGSRRVLVSHGWIADSHMFDPMLEFVEPGEFTVALLDHRGYGARRDEHDGHDIDTSALDIIAAANTLGWDTFGIIGHSMGGLAAQRVAADSPERLSSIVLAAPVPAGEAQLEPAVLADRLAAVGDLARRRVTIDTNAQHSSTADTIYALNVESTSDDVLASYLNSWASADFAADLSGCAVPTLVLYGRDDPAIPEALLRRTLARWFTDVRITGLPTGHYPMIQAPQAFWDVCASHLHAAATRSRARGPGA